MSARFRKPSSSSLRADRSSSPHGDAGDGQPLASGRAVPGAKPSSTAAATFSSSLRERPPARSFISQASSNYPDIAQYSSHDVRAQTSELASFTFPDSFSPKQRLAESSSSFIPLQEASTSDDAAKGFAPPPARPVLRKTSEASHPDVIPELSEPSTPTMHSALTDMFRRDTAAGGSGYHGDLRAEPKRSHPQLGVRQDTEPQEDAFVHEQTPLITRQDLVDELPTKAAYSTFQDVEGQDTQRLKPKENQFQMLVREAKARSSFVVHVATHPKSWDRKAIFEEGVMKPVKLLPCVFLGVLLNMLDALSYGMILFPLGESVFEKTGPDGISIFYVSCIVSQLVYSCGGSVFKGAVGSEMIEVVPFFHKMASTVVSRVGPGRPDVVLATTITSYALSSILTGVVFFSLGTLKLGSLVNFFPRNILIGCIGGVGFFLFVTGVEVSAQLSGNLEYKLETLKQLFSSDTIALWTVPLALSIVLLIIKRYINSPYAFPAFFLGIALIFYIVMAAVPNLSIQDLRDKGWVFPAVDASTSFYHFYSYYDFRIIDWSALGACIPAMFALTFFGILHVPINVPALAIAAEEDDLNLNRELVAHGVSNTLSGLIGSIQNYLVYVNSALFIQNGGNSRLAGLLLAAATAGIWMAGPVMIGFVPIMIVGTLIFYLGIELLQEALVDPWGAMNRLEYLTVLAIVLIMGVYDFVAGIVAGIILACLNFVIQSSHKPTIRACYSGEIVESTVRRHPIQRHYLREVGHQISVTKLAGYLFFGSIVQVEKQSRAHIDEEEFNTRPIRYLIFDFAHVTGIDYSAAEAFSRMERVLGRRQVKMIFCGVGHDDEVGRSLRNVGVWAEHSSCEFFENLNTALEWCENQLLQTFYRERDAMDKQVRRTSDPLDVAGAESTHLQPPLAELERKTSLSSLGAGANLNTIVNSPRQSWLQQAATATLASPRHMVLTRSYQYSTFRQPLALLLQAFQELTDKNEDFWYRVLPYFTQQHCPAGTVLFNRGDPSTGFYLIQSGMLRADYYLPVGTYHESIVAGTTCGELPFFSGTDRTADVSAERDSVVWKMGVQDWARLQAEWEEGARELLAVALKLTKERVDAVTAYVLTTAG